MMRLISGGLYITAVASYGICLALIILGLLTLVIALFKGNISGQLGGLGVIVIALCITAATATTMHCHRRSTQ